MKMKTVNIYVCGKYDYGSRIGTWIYYLEYNGAVKKQSAQAGGIKSHVQIVLLALWKALQALNQPCNLIVHSKQPLGFKHPHKSANAELINKIMRCVWANGHIISFEDGCHFEQVQEWENLYGNKKDTVNTKVNTTEDEEKHLEKMKEEVNQDWKAMYSDLMGPSESKWVPGSGGY